MNIFKIKNNSHIINSNDLSVIFVIVTIISVILGVLVVISPYIAFALIATIGIIMFISKEPLRILILLILVSPFATTVYLRENIANIPGFKPILILGLLTAIVSLFNFQKASKMPKHAYYFLFAIIMIFTISIFRSLPHLDVFNKYYYVTDKLTTYGYLLSAYIKELVFILPFLVIIKYANNEHYLNRIYDIVYLTIIILSIHLLYMYFQGAKGMGLNDISEYYESTYGMNRNQLAMFFICGLPFALRKYFLNKKLLNIAFIVIILISIGFLYSRTGYGAAIFAIIFYLVISKRKILLPIFIGAFIGLAMVASTDIISRATTGFGEKDRDKISAGRIDQIWIPLIEENINDTKKLIFGDGRNAIRASDSLLKGKIAFAGEPHNMYLELLLDAGLISLIIVLSFYYVIIRNAVITLKTTNDIVLEENLYACIVSITGYLLSGMTGHSFFPTNSNILIWVVLGCTIASCQKTQSNNVKNISNKN